MQRFCNGYSLFADNNYGSFVKKMTDEMKRACLLLGLFLFLSIDCFSQMYPPYFSRRSYFNKKCEYVVKGVIIGKKAIAYLSDDGEIKDSIVALNIQVIDSYNYDIEDTVWVYTDFAKYFSRKRKIDTSNRDSVWFLQFEDVNWESCTHINFDRFDRVYNNFAIGKPGYFRFWKDNGYYVYGFEDEYVSLIIHDDGLFVRRNRWDEFIGRLLIPLDRFNFVSAKQFERTLKRRKR